MIDWKKVLANEGKKKANEYMHQILKDFKLKNDHE